MSAPIQPTEMDDYLFDLQGFLILRGALSAEEVGRLNDEIDSVPELDPGDWHGHVHCQNMPREIGVNLQQIYEVGPGFQSLIDHPSWIAKVNRYVGADDGLFIDENFISLRGPGEAISIHSGAHKRRVRTQFRFHNGEFRCGQINILMALTDIGPGDGATMVIPGSHKANLIHPAYERSLRDQSVSVDGVECAIEVHLQKGDAILFVDAISHGSAARINNGERRIAVFRYGPKWGNFRFGYEPSDALLARLTPTQRAIVQPVKPQRPNSVAAAL